MSSAFPSDSTAGADRGISLRTAVKYPLRALGFWAAVVLPFVLLWLIVSGIAQQSPTILTGVVSANVAALVLGREYKR
ncbi:hypothetical protein GRX03_09070 [Halovenus sp. WSH3]|uniref:Uncharacterized protein n=1 Tax=Halovenus carboxidivorans TaxID=2692199 RepID=A0A6B0T817_9EURY|nr:hypothetical protein [Halovenus carboxidivorans]MXR51753.1 hypothetical protein [Halovenus carboxidivorans]